MDALIQILTATFVISLVSIVGILLFFRQKRENKLLFLLVSFAAGSMLGVAFLDLLPEVLKDGFNENVPIFIIAGILSFFVLEKFLYWHHHHSEHEHEEVHSFTYMNLIGDSLHNFVDGIVVAISFMNGTAIGITTTIAIIAHEIPQEISDFGVLIYGGFSKAKALIYNFLTALTAVLGAILTFFFSSLVESASAYITSFAIGGFVYIAGTDLIPEIQKEKNWKKSLLQLLMLVLGVGTIWLIGAFVAEH